MNSYAYYNGKFGRLEEIKIPLSDRSVFFGDGVYDAALVSNGKIIWEDEHVERFFCNLNAIGLKADFTREKLKNLLRKIVNDVNFESAFLYFQLTRSLEKRIHSAVDSQGSNLLITIEKFELQSPETKLSLITFPDKRYGYCNIKTLNLLPSVFAASEAHRCGCDEAVFIRDGIVTECSRSNVFIVKNGTLITHPTSDRILPGITRFKIISACQNLSIPVIERPFTVDEMISAEEILISSTTKLVLGAKRINGVNVGGKESALRRMIHSELYKDFVEKSIF